MLDEFNNARDSGQQAGFENFARQLALAISSILRNNLNLIEETCNIMEPNELVNRLRNAVLNGLTYLAQLSRIPEEELFKICLDFWKFFSYDVMEKQMP